MRKYVPVEMPVGAEVAAHRFAAACKRDGMRGCVVLTCSDGSVDSWTYTGADGPHTLALMDGGWYEWGEVGDGRDV